MPLNIEGNSVRRRAVEPEDLDVLYRWENDPDVWSVSGTTEPFSLHQMRRFIAEQQAADIFRTGQLRLMIEAPANGSESSPAPSGQPWRPVGAVDLFEFDPQHRRAGIGILIHDPAHRGKGFAADALDVVCRYARTVLGLHQLWCNVGVDNTASLALFRRAGFAETGRKREWQWTPDGFRDEIMMQKILSDEG